MSLPASNIETAATSLEDAGVVGKLGLKTEVFVAQLINFLIILIVLWRWGYKPLVRMMEERQKRIQQGLADATAAAKVVAAAEEKYAAKLKEARGEAAKLMKEAEQRGEGKREEMLSKAREEIAKLITDARAKIGEERALAETELKKEISVLVVTTAEMVLKEKLAGAADTVLMEKTVRKAPKKK